MSPRPKRKPVLGISPPVYLSKSAIEAIGPERAGEAAALIAERIARSSNPAPESELVKQIRANPELIEALISGLLFRLGGLNDQQDAADLREFVFDELGKLPAARKKGRPKKGQASWLTEFERLADRQQFDRFQRLVHIRTERYKANGKKKPFQLAFAETKKELGIYGGLTERHYRARLREHDA